jgi:5-methylcytosine-specific restriction enzyme subunit McrC
MPPAERHTLHLTERQPTSCALAAADIDYLLAHHTAQLEIRPQCRGQYQLTPRGYVGTLLTPGLRLEIAPKIPLRNVLHLLDSDLPLLPQHDTVATMPGQVLLNTLAARLAQLMRQQAVQGLPRAYVERREQGPFLQGRLDVVRQVRQAPGHKERLACAFEDFTSDVPLNQIPRSTAAHVLAHAELGEAARQQLQHALAGYEEITPLVVTAQTFAQVQRQPLPDGIRSLLELCQLLLEGSFAAQQTGSVPYPAFLLSLERAFEQYGTRLLRQAVDSTAGRLTLQAQLSCVPHPRQPGQPDLRMRPDVLLCRDDQPVLVVDLKWKSSPPVRADLYQILAYCAALGCTRGALIYPGTRSRRWLYHFAAANLTMAIYQVRLTGAPAACDRGLGKIARQLLREWD